MPVPDKQINNYKYINELKKIVVTFEADTSGDDSSS